MTTHATFRVRFWPVFLVVNAAIQVTLGGPFLAAHLLPQRPFRRADVGALLVVGAGLSVWSAFWLGLCRWLYVVRVSRVKLRSFDFWGSPQSARWGAMTAARRSWRLGFPSVRVRTAGGRILYVPLPVHKIDRLAAFVARAAKPDHPLAVTLAPYRRTE